MNNGTDIGSHLLDLMLRAGSSWILYLLLGLSLLAMTIMVDRIWFFFQERTPMPMLAAAVRELRRDGPDAALETLAGARSMQVAVARACLNHAHEGIAAVEERKAGAIEAERARYEKRLAFLGTLGNNAPFMGLFGTVLGIIRAFHDLAGSSLQGTQAVMSGIAEALVATGVGLLVALPAVAAYNIFTRRVERTISATEVLAHEILAVLKAEPARGTGYGSSRAAAE
jgi:biopolymer transport protein ExbB/TolQ